MVLAPLDFIAPLFVPADRPDRFAKAAASGADAIIVDLEDAVSPAAKDRARNALNADFTDLPVVVRINAADTPQHEADLAAVARHRFAAIMLPKARHSDDLTRVAALRPVIALIETVAGLAEARAIAARSPVARLAFGSIDYAADLGCDHVPEALAAARAELVMASRLGRLPPPLDGVTPGVADNEALSADASRAAAMGFGGKLAIHPRQVGTIRRAFQPTPEMLEWARRVVASGDGVSVLEGAMIDAPVRSRARGLLARASKP